jgi:hypothetical protein
MEGHNDIEEMHDIEPHTQHNQDSGRGAARRRYRTGDDRLRR